MLLLSNCTKQSTNNARIEYKYLAILYGYLDSCLFCTIKILFDRLATLACVVVSKEKKMDEIFASADCDCVDLLPSFELSLKF